MQVFGPVGAGYWKQHVVKCLIAPTHRNQREQSRQVAPLVLYLSWAWLLVLGQPPERELHWLWNSYSKAGWDIILWLCNYRYAAQNVHSGLSVVTHRTEMDTYLSLLRLFPIASCPLGNSTVLLATHCPNCFMCFPELSAEITMPIFYRGRYWGWAECYLTKAEWLASMWQWLQSSKAMLISVWNKSRKNTWLKKKF